MLTRVRFKTNNEDWRKSSKYFVFDTNSNTVCIYYLF